MAGDRKPFGASDVRRLYSSYNFLHQAPRASLLARLARRVRGVASRLRRPFEVSAAPPVLLQTSLRRTLDRLGVRRPVVHVLDAGSGAGGLAAALAGQDPVYRVTGADLTPDHVRISRERYGDIPNLRFVECDLCDAGSLRSRLAAPEGGYDVISSIGVLHHLPEPLRGLENLSALLHREGVFFIYLYDKFARFLAHSVREAVFTLGGEDMTPEDRVRLAKIVLGHATRQARYRQLLDEDMPGQHDAVIADTFCHPLEQIYSVHDAKAFLAGAGLGIIGFFDMGSFGADPFLALDRCLSDLVEGAPAADASWLRGLAGRLSGLDKAHLVDVLMDRHSFQGLLLAAGHEGVYPAIG